MAGEIPKSIKASLYIDGKPAVSSLKEVEQGTLRLNRELSLLTPGTEAFNKKLKEVAANKKYIRDIKDEINGVSGAFGRLKKELGTLGTMALGYLGFEFVSQQFQQIISTNAKLSDSLADVRKTTGLTEEQVLSLNKQLKQIDTRTSRSELLALAEVAGKLGVSAQEDVLGFVRAADKISVALGKDLGDTEQAVNDLGKLTDLFKIKDQFGLEQSLLKTGSAINALGAAGPANEGYIVEFTKRLGTIAPAANISIENIMGLGATMDELGQPAEAASTALAQFIVGMGKDLPTFAKVAGMSIKNFGALLKKDGNEALITVLQSLRTTGGGVQELAAKMGLIGEEGARATAALGALSNNLDKLKSRQAMSNAEFAKGTSLTDEFNVKNENLASTLDKIGKWFYGMATSKVISNTLDSAANGFARLVGLSQSHAEKLDVEQTKLFALRIELESNNTTTNRRKEILGELQGMYPEYLSNIDKEHTKNSDLLPILERINQQYVIRIAYQKRMEELDAAVKDEADSMNDVYDNQQKLIMSIGTIQSELRKDGIKFTIEGNNENEKAFFIYKNLNKAIAEQAVGNKALQAIQGNNKYDNLISGLNRYGNAMKAANQELTANTNARVKIEKEATKFKNSFKPEEITGSEKMQMQANILVGRLKSMNKESKEHKDTLKTIQNLNTVIAMQKYAEKFSNTKDTSRLAEINRLNADIARKKKEFGLLKENSVVKSGGDYSYVPTPDKNAESEAEKKRKKELAEAERLKDDLYKIGSEVYKNSLNQHDQEVFAISEKYKALRERTKENSEERFEVDRLEGAEIVALQKKITAESKKETEELVKNRLEAEAKIFEGTLSATTLEIAQAEKKYEDLIALAKQYGIDYTAVIVARDAELARLKLKAEGGKTPKELADETKAQKVKEGEEYLALARGVADSASSIVNDGLRSESNSRLKALESQRDVELSNKNLTEEQKERINRDFDDRVRQERIRAWRAEQKAAVAQALVNGALAMTKVSAQTGVLTFAFSPAVAAMTALQVGVIASQSAPEFAVGGMTDQDPAGYVSNSTLFNSSASGRPFVAGEKGREWIAPNWMVQSPRFANIIGSLEVARKEKRMYATGGFNSENTTSTLPAQSGYDFYRLEAKLDAFVDTQTKHNSIPVVLDYAVKEQYERKLLNDRNSQMG